MSELRNTLKMLSILKRKGKIKAKDIAEELEVSERQIRRYKEILDEFFNIESTIGPDGGYKLKQECFPFKELLNDEEILNLKIAIKAVDSLTIQNNKELLKAIDKINFSILNSEKFLNTTEQLIPYSIPKQLNEEGMVLYEDFLGAINNKKKVYIKYRANSGNLSDREIEPLMYLSYKGEYYIVAHCLLRNKIRYFKLTRIVDYKILISEFEFNGDIEKIILEERKNGFGIFGGEKYEINLIIKPPIANTVKERIWVEDQMIEEFDDGTINFKATMKGGPELISWILSMGDAAIVKEPKEIKNILKEKLYKMIENL